MWHISCLPVSEYGSHLNNISGLRLCFLGKKQYLGVAQLHASCSVKQHD